MKALLFSTVLLLATAARAAEPTNYFYCWSLKAPSYTLTVGPVAVKASWPNTQHQIRSYPVVVKNSQGKVVGTYDGSGELTESKAEIRLITGGDMIVGHLSIAWAYNHFSGAISTSSASPQAKLDFQMACSAKK